MSSKTMYLVTGGIILLAIVGFGGYKAWHHFAKNPVTTLYSSSPTVTPQATGSSGLSNTNTSNQQLDNDMQDIQNSMDQLQKDQNTSNQDTSKESSDAPQY